MLLRRLTVMILAVCAFFAIHSPAWAAAVNTQPAQPAAVEMALTPQQQAAVEMMLAQAEGRKPLIKVESWTWLFSIVPGLGQVLMGDLIRGLLFFLAPVAISIVGGILVTALAVTLGPTAGLVGIILPLISLGVW